MRCRREQGWVREEERGASGSKAEATARVPGLWQFGLAEGEGPEVFSKVDEGRASEIEILWLKQPLSVPEAVGLRETQTQEEQVPSC